jgi:hypothetical protein
MLSDVGDSAKKYKTAIFKAKPSKFLIFSPEAMATDQPDKTSTVRTSTSYRSTAL